MKKSRTPSQNTFFEVSLVSPLTARLILFLQVSILSPQKLAMTDAIDSIVSVVPPPGRTKPAFMASVLTLTGSIGRQFLLPNCLTRLLQHSGRRPSSGASVLGLSITKHPLIPV